MKLTIKNRDGKKISLILNKKNHGLAIIAHGYSGFKEQKQIEIAQKSFEKNNITTIRYDARNTFGQSEGKLEDGNAQNYLEDLEDVIVWAKSQKFYSEPFYLCGFSLGGLSTLIYSENNPSEIRGIVAISPVISGKLFRKAKGKKHMTEWREKKWKIVKSKSKKDSIKRIPWSFVQTLDKFDATKKAHKLKMPILYITGSKDLSTAPPQYMHLMNKKTKNGEVHIIKGAEHTFREQKHLKEQQYIITNWIKRIEKC